MLTMYTDMCQQQTHSKLPTTPELCMHLCTNESCMYDLSMNLERLPCDLSIPWQRSNLESPVSLHLISRAIAITPNLQIRLQVLETRRIHNPDKKKVKPKSKAKAKGTSRPSRDPMANAVNSQNPAHTQARHSQVSSANRSALTDTAPSKRAAQASPAAAMSSLRFNSK